VAISETNRRYNIVPPVPRQQDQDPRFTRDARDARDANTLTQGLARNSPRSDSDRIVWGELLDVLEQQRHNNALAGQQVSPENRIAIENNLSGDDPCGRLLDRLA
jgi:hypothetical protein